MISLSRRRLLQVGAAVSGALAAPRLALSQAAKPLRFVPQADLTIVDPIWTTATVTNTHALLVFDTLYGLDAQYRAHPQMAEGHTVEDDGRRWTIRLRDGLRFHDGTPVRAADVVASIERWGARDMFGQAVRAVADEIRASDDRTLVFRLKHAFPLLPEALGKVSPSMCAIMPERIARTAASKAVTEVIGSGPYRFLADERVVGSRVAYARFDGYRPSAGSGIVRTAGPKIGQFERIEWQVIPDQATAAAALQAGEVDWLDTVTSDLLPLLKRAPGVSAGYTDDRASYLLRFNHLHPPFDNPAIRRALLGAVNQTDYMTAGFGDDPEAWRVGVGVFLSETPMASEAGLDVLRGPRDLARVQREIMAAGYKGERVVVLQPEDFPTLKGQCEVAVDMLRRVGMNVDVQSLDWGTVVQRRASREPVDKGGWSIFITGTSTTLDPSSNLGLRANGAQAWFGWPDDPELEALRSAWFEAPSEAAQQAICRDMQLRALQSVPFIPLGEAFRLSAHRADLSGFPTGMINMFGVRRG